MSTTALVEIAANYEPVIGQIIDEVVAGNPKQVEQYRGGKTAVLGFLVGRVMKAAESRPIQQR